MTTVHISAQGFIPTFQCQVVDGNKCLLKGLDLDRKQFTFDPRAADPSVIRRISIENSTIPIIDDSICKTFPHVTDIDINKAGVQEIRANAFTGCTELKMLELDGNQVKLLSPGLFAANAKLEFFSICENQLEQVDKNLFQGASRLTNVFLGSNLIKRLDPEVFRNMKHLQKLDLYNNELGDLEVEAILGHTPALNTINLRFNYFKCERLEKILKVLHEKKVDLEKVDWIEGKKGLKYTAQWIEDIECDNGGKPIVKKDDPNREPKKVKEDQKKDGKKDDKKANGAMLAGAQMSVIILSVILGRFI